MTEAEWVACGEANRMLEYLLDASALEIKRPNNRQLRLFSVALARAMRSDLDPDEYPTMIEWAEQSVEGRALPPYSPYWVMNQDTEMAAWQAIARRWGASTAADTLREIVGNPFRPSRAVASWLTPATLSTAHAAYDLRNDDGTLQVERLLILSDALEEAGCTDEAILTHLRSPGPHIRGCWPLDLVLGKA